MKTFAARSLGTLANCLLVAVSFLSVDSQAQPCIGLYFVNVRIDTDTTCSSGYVSYDNAYYCKDNTWYPQWVSTCGSPIPSCFGNCPPHEPCTGKIGTASVGCEEPRDQCEAQAGGPVHVTTGSMWVRPEPDLTIAGPFPLSIQRGYWSVRADRQVASTLPSGLGWGWGISLFESLYVETPPPPPAPPGPSGESVTVRRWDGALDIFRATLPGAAEHVGQPGKRQSLRFVPASATALASYRLTEENGTVRVFEKSVLRYIEPPGAPALRHELCYTDSTNSAFPSSSACLCGTSFAAMSGKPVPCKLKPSSGPPVFLNWQVLGANPVLKSLTWNSPTGQEIAKYEYDPATIDLRFAKLAKSPGVFETWDYRYDAQHHLTRVVDPALVDAETFIWTNGKVTATTTPTQSFAFTYGADQTTVAEAKGPTSYTLKFNAFKDPTEISPGCGCNTNVAEYIWDSPLTGKQGQRDIKAVKYADGSFTSYVLNAAGDRVKIVQGDIDHVAATVPPGAVFEERTYHPHFRALTSVSRPGLSLNTADKTHVIYDYQDPSSSPPDPFCLTAACDDPSDYNKTNVTGLLRREIRKGFTKKTDGTFATEAVTYVRTYIYDPMGRLVFTLGPTAGEETDFVYFAANAPATKAGRLQFIKRKVAAPATFLVTEIVDYDNRGSPREVIDESGQTWTFTTERERITSAKAPGSTHPLVLEYGTDGKLDVVTLPLGNVIKYTYNTKRQLIGIARAASKTGTTLFDRVQFDRDPARGLVLFERSFHKVPGQPEVEYLTRGFSYDSLGRRTATEIFRSNATSPDFFDVLQYDAVGNIAKNADANHATSAADPVSTHFNVQYLYSTTGILKTLSRFLAAGGPVVTEMAFDADAHNNVHASTDGESRVTTYVYDDFDRVVEVSGHQNVKYAYDASDRLVARKDDVSTFFQHETVGYQYDLAGRETSSGWLGPSINDGKETRTYDEADETLTKCVTGGPGGDTVLLSNRRGRMSSLSRLDFPPAAGTIIGPATGNVLKYGYDAQGRLAVEARRVGQLETCWNVIERNYTENGRLAKLTYPSGRVVTSVYAGADIDRPTSLTSTTMSAGVPSTVTIVSGIGYQGERPTQWTTSSGLSTRVTTSLDGTELRRTTTAGASTVFDQWIQSRDGMGNIKKLVDMPLTAATQTQDFTYSERSELESASLSGRAGAYEILSYTYNKAGDRSSATRGWRAGPTIRMVTTNYSYVGFKLDNLYRFVASVPFREYIYTANESRPAQVLEHDLSWELGYFRGGLGTGLLDGPPSFLSQYSYDGLARRVFREKPRNRVSVQEFWDEDGKLLSEIGYNSIVQADPRPVFDYVYLGDEPVALLTATWDSTGVGPGTSVSSGGPLVNGAAYGLHGNHLGRRSKRPTLPRRWFSRQNTSRLVAL